MEVLYAELVLGVAPRQYLRPHVHGDVRQQLQQRLIVQHRRFQHHRLDVLPHDGHIAGAGLEIRL